eukprot:Rhum_TRINITY_DN1143_c0_g1::Rhum_TRINITY_DN1143_c0_g1_i1::g.3303::m.3303
MTTGPGPGSGILARCPSAPDAPRKRPRGRVRRSTPREDWGKRFVGATVPRCQPPYLRLRAQSARPPMEEEKRRRLSTDAFSPPQPPPPPPPPLSFASSLPAHR